MGHNFRYPGVQPFSENSQNVFFGRDGDTRELLRWISMENPVVLYGKSGLGKTSLLNAAVVPILRSEANYQPLTIRLGNCDNVSRVNPVDVSISMILSGISVDHYLDDIPVAEPSIWQALKKLQVCNPVYNDGRFILIFDQFEELFTYNDGLDALGHQLADLINKRIPSDFRKNLRRAMAVDDVLKEQINDDELDMLMSPLDVKVVFSLRSDKMGMLNRLKPSMPNILQHAFELLPLNREQGREAIEKPASSDGDFRTDVFTYSPQTVDKILDFLQKSSSMTNADAIESFQLQIVCKHIENRIVEGKIQPVEGAINVSLSDIDMNLDTILEQYYEEQISALDPNDQEVARELVEDGLILEKEQRRVSLDVEIIKTDYPKVSDHLLHRLVDSHLLRSEPNPFGAVSFELSHDTLIEPILRRKRERYERKMLHEQKILQQKQAEDNMKLEQKKMRRYMFIGTYVVVAVVVLILSIALAQVLKSRNVAYNANAKLSELRTSDVNSLLIENRLLTKIKKRDSLYIVEKNKRYDSIRNLLSVQDSMVHVLTKNLKDTSTLLKARLSMYIDVSSKGRSLDQSLQQSLSRINDKENEIQRLNTVLLNREKQLTEANSNYLTNKLLVRQLQDQLNQKTVENNNLKVKIQKLNTDIQNSKISWDRERAKASDLWRQNMKMMSKPRADSLKQKNPRN